jgi:hypothetical protein
MGDSRILLRAEDQAHRRVLMRMRPMFTCVVGMQVHLAGIGVSEFSELQVYDDETSKPTVGEDQINPVPLRSYSQSPLSGDKCEVSA